MKIEKKHQVEKIFGALSCCADMEDSTDYWTVAQGLVEKAFSDGKLSVSDGRQGLKIKTVVFTDSGDIELIVDNNHTKEKPQQGWDKV